MEDFEGFKNYIRKRISDPHHDGWGRDVVSIEMNLSMADAKGLLRILDDR